MDEIYRIIYVVDEAKAVKGLHAIDAALVKTQAGLLKTAGMLKDLGKNTPGITRIINELKKLDTELQHKVVDADKAETALKKVGQGNKSVAALTKRVTALKDQLENLASSANSAASGVANVGKGAKLPPGNVAGGAGKAGGIGIGGRIGIGVGVGAAAVGIRRAAGAVGEAGQGMRQFMDDAADKAKEFRESLREVANLSGSPQVTDKILHDQLSFQRHTGMDADEARAFREQYLGAVASGQQRGNIDQKTSEELEKEAGRFAVRYALDPQTAGKMAGLVGEYQKVPSAAVGVGVMAEAAEHLNRYGVGQVRSMMGPMMGLAGEMVDENGGRFGNIGALSATYAASTVRAKSPAIAATQIRQANNALRKFNGGDEEAFLRANGITPQDPYETAIRKIAPKITGSDGDLILARAGFGNQRERASLRTQASLIPVIDENLRDKEGVITRARDQAVQNNAAAQTTPEGRSRLAEARQFDATVKQGIKGDKFRVAKEEARARMTKDGNLKAGPIGAINDMVRSAMSLGSVSGEEMRVEAEAIESLAQEGKRVGVEVYKDFPSLEGTQRALLGQDPQIIQDQFNMASDTVEAAKALQAMGRAAGAAAGAVGKLGKGRIAPPKGPEGGAGFNPGRR